MVLHFASKYSEEVELHRFLVAPVLRMALIWMGIFIAQVAHVHREKTQICCS